MSVIQASFSGHPTFDFTYEDLVRLNAALTTLTRPKPVSLAQWSHEVTFSYKGKAKSTRLKMGQALREALELAGRGASTANLTPDLVERFALRPGRCSTTNGLLASLRAAFRFAAKKGYLRTTVTGDCQWTVDDIDPPRLKHHGREEIARVLDSLRKDPNWSGRRLHAFGCVLAYSGLRRNEALRLKTADIDILRGFVFVRPNGKKLKTRSSQAPVPMPKVLCEVLRTWLPKSGCEWLFPNLNRRGPWVGGAKGYRAGDKLKAEAERVGVKDFTPHSLRHSLATHYAGYWGLSGKQIQMVLRHSKETTQGLYIHSDLVNLRAIVESFDFLSSRPSPVRPPAPV